MGVREARYDGATDWYVGFDRAWATDARPPLPADVSGHRDLRKAPKWGTVKAMRPRSPE